MFPYHTVNKIQLSHASIRWLSIKAEIWPNKHKQQKHLNI